MSAPVDRWTWLDVVRRARLGRTTKAVAVMLATYADRDGTHIFPGLPRIAVACEIGYNTAQKCLTELRDLGFIERVYRASQPGRADDYQLILDEGVAERVPTPAQIDLEIHRMRKPWGKPLTARKVEAKPDEESPLPTAQGEAKPDDAADAGGTSTHGASDEEQTSTHGTTEPLPAPCVATPHAHEHLTSTSHETADLRTAVTVAREADAVEEPIFTEEEKPRLRLVTDEDVPPRPVVGSRRWSSRGQDAIAEAVARRAAARAAHQSQAQTGEAS